MSYWYESEKGKEWSRKYYEKNKEYNPIVWPYIKNKDLIWPERTAIYKVNLNNHDDWDMQGNQTFTGSLNKLNETDDLK